MRVIFWDIDGVLNNPGTYRRRAEAPAWADLLEPALVARAAAVTLAVGAKCVLSSTWRLSGYERTLLCLEQRGWATAYEDFIGQTPHLPCAIRGLEIGEWLSAHPDVRAWCIVDDDSDMGGHSRRLVQTDGAQGLTDADCQRIRTMLGEPQKTLRKMRSVHRIEPTDQ